MPSHHDLSAPYDPSSWGRPLPGMEASELDWLWYRQHDVIARAQALSFMSSGALARRLASGRWQRAHRSVYVRHNGPATEHERLWIAVLAVGGGRRCFVGGLSALRVLGLRRITSPAVHVLLPARLRDRDPPRAVVVHRTSVLPDSDCRRTGDPPCTTAARSVVDAAQWARSDDEARTIIAASFQQRIVSGDEIDAVLARTPVIRRRALIVETVRDARDGSETITELDLVALCRRFGLPTPSRQVVRRDASGRTRYLDALFEEWGVRLEIDGAHHMEVDQWWRDMRRHNDLATSGEILLRFPGWALRRRPGEVAAAIRRALHAAGWRPNR